MDEQLDIYSVVSANGDTADEAGQQSNTKVRHDLSKRSCPSEETRGGAKNGCKEKECFWQRA